MPSQSALSLLVLAVTVVVAIFIGLPAIADGIPYNMPVKRVDIDTAEKLDRIFRRAHYTLQAARKSRSVPRLFVRRLPGDLNDLPADRRASVFIRAVLPLVAKANQTILRQRRRLIALLRQRRAGWLWNRSERLWLDQLAGLYRVSPDDPARLLRRVDIVPPSLAVAQAIEDSNWGTAKGARAGNRLIGASAGDAPVAEGRAGEPHPTLLRGVLAYVYRFNVAVEFTKMRHIRAEVRDDGDLPDGADMLDGLADDTTAGTRYAERLRELMQRYDLDDFDRVRLSPNGGTTLISVTR